MSKFKKIHFRILSHHSLDSPTFTMIGTPVTAIANPLNQHMQKQLNQPEHIVQGSLPISKPANQPNNPSWAASGQRSHIRTNMRHGTNKTTHYSTFNMNKEMRKSGEHSYRMSLYSFDRPTVTILRYRFLWKYDVLKLLEKLMLLIKS